MPDQLFSSVGASCLWWRWVLGELALVCRREPGCCPEPSRGVHRPRNKRSVLLCEGMYVRYGTKHARTPRRRPNFRERRKSEVQLPRIPIPRTSANRAQPRSSVSCRSAPSGGESGGSGGMPRSFRAAFQKRPGAPGVPSRMPRASLRTSVGASRDKAL